MKPIVFHVEAAGEFRSVEFTFASEPEVRRVRSWRKMTSATDAGEFAALAAKRWFYYTRQGATVASLDELRRAIMRNPRAELAFLLVASAEWARVAPILRTCGLVSEAERSSLLALCIEWSRYQEAHGKVRSLGTIVQKGPTKIPIVNPYLMVANHAMALCLKLWAELGLTPSSRSRLAAIPAGDMPELSKWGGDL